VPHEGARDPRLNDAGEARVAAAVPRVRGPEWLAIGALIAFVMFQLARFQSDLLVATVAGVCAVLIGLGALAVASVVAIRAPGVRTIVLVLVLVAAGVGWWRLPVHRVGAWVRAFREEPQYLAVIAEIEAGNTPACIAAARCYFEPGPPRRVGFVWSRILDNWVGVIHDPSGTVTDVERQRKLFGGDLVAVDHLFGAWYFCVFD
jgi:hypothetical protein